MPSKGSGAPSDESRDGELAAAAEALRRDCRRLANLTAALRTGGEDRLEAACARHLGRARELRERISERAADVLQGPRSGRMDGAAAAPALREAGEHLGSAAAGYEHVCRRLQEMIEGVTRELTSVDRGRRALQSYGNADRPAG